MFKTEDGPIAGVAHESPASAPCAIVNADDWGRDAATTDRTLDCARRGALSSVSAMVFMEDSERAAALALEGGIDSGLHLNFTAPFDAPRHSTALEADRERICRFLRAHRYAPAIYHPGLADAFRSTVEAQLEEYRRLYGCPPRRIDGHHHMHLSANVVLGKLLPAGTIVRRNFSFQSGEKSFLNRRYRNWQDRLLARRHPMTDFFFCLPPMTPLSRLQGIFALAARHSVEVETHPIVEGEYRFLMDGGLTRSMGDVQVARSYLLPAGERSGKSERTA